MDSLWRALPRLQDIRILRPHHSEMSGAYHNNASFGMEHRAHCDCKGLSVDKAWCIEYILHLYLQVGCDSLPSNRHKGNQRASMRLRPRNHQQHRLHRWMMKPCVMCVVGMCVVERVWCINYWLNMLPRRSTYVVLRLWLFVSNKCYMYSYEWLQNRMP